jgi:hypothetical protein
MARARWRAVPTQQLAAERADTGFDGAPAPEAFAVRRELKRLTLDGVSTVVQVTRPDAPGRFPAFLFCHGAGTGNHTAFDEHCAALARRGVVGVVPDKDLTAYSTLRRDYAHMARQYAELSGWARGQDWLAPGRLGYYAESEGAWLAPWAAAESPADFMALVSAPVVSPRRQSLYAIGTYLTSVDAPASAFDAGVRVAGATMPLDWFEYVDFDCLPYLERLACPVFMAYGSADISMPVVEGASLVMGATSGPVAVRYYARADHGLRRGEDRHVSSTFLSDLAAWTLCLENDPAPTPAVAGLPPVQPFAAAPPAPTGPVTRDAWLVLAALAALAGAGVGARSEPARLRRPLALLRAGAVATLLAQAAYLGFLFRLAGSYRTAPRAVRLGHRLVRGTGLATAIAGALTAWRGLRFTGPAGPASAGTASAARTAAAGRTASTARVAAGLTGAAILARLARRWGAF